MKTVGERKLGIGLEKWMGEDKDGRKGREGCEGYVLSICCSKHGNPPFFVPVFPTPDHNL